MAKVELDAVHKRYGDVHVVRGVTLAIEEGEFLVLVGRSGCGKSTCLRMIAGLVEISDGEIRIGGKRVNDVPPKDRDMAMVFQNYALYPHMTVYQNMSFGLRLKNYPKPEIESRVQEAARILDIQDLLERKPRQLSGGQRQRVAMGRAIVRNPKVFLFDEPLSNLDAKLRARTRVEVKRLLARFKITAVYVTHDQVEAIALADRIAVMHQGRIEQVGTYWEVHDQPVNAFVAGFVGTPPANFLKGRVADGVLKLEGGQLPLRDQWRAHSCWSPGCCSSTSRSRTSTPSCADACARTSATCSSAWASRWSTSPMTSRRRWPFPTASSSWTMPSSPNPARRASSTRSLRACSSPTSLATPI